MTSRIWSQSIVLLLLALAASAQNPQLSKTVEEFVRVQAPKVVLTHVRIIDGTGAPGGRRSECRDRGRKDHGDREGRGRAAPLPVQPCWIFTGIR